MELLAKSHVIFFPAESTGICGTERGYNWRLP